MFVPSPWTNSDIATSECRNKCMTNNCILITVACEILKRETKRQLTFIYMNIHFLRSDQVKPIPATFKQKGSTFLPREGRVFSVWNLDRNKERARHGAEPMPPKSASMEVSVQKHNIFTINHRMSDVIIFQTKK